MSEVRVIEVSGCNTCPFRKEQKKIMPFSMGEEYYVHYCNAIAFYIPGKPLPLVDEYMKWDSVQKFHPLCPLPKQSQKGTE